MGETLESSRERDPYNNAEKNMCTMCYFSMACVFMEASLRSNENLNLLHRIENFMWKLFK